MHLRPERGRGRRDGDRPRLSRGLAAAAIVTSIAIVATVPGVSAESSPASSSGEGTDAPGLDLGDVVPIEALQDPRVTVTPDGLLVDEPTQFGPFPSAEARAALEESGTVEEPGGSPSESLGESDPGPFQRHSLAGADLTIYLDFDGHTTTGTAWNRNVYYGNGPTEPIVSVPYSIDGDPAFSSTELDYVVKAWEMVSEDFAAWNVNVTTEDPGTEALRRTGGGDTQYGVRVVISPTDEWYTSSGGVAYINSFTSSEDRPVFVFSDNTGGGYWKYVAEAAAHEAGHAFGLLHDGVVGGSAYYSGHQEWAPIMGVGYGRDVTQWSIGEYTGANNTQDDVAIITGKLGLLPTPPPTPLGPPGSDIATDTGTVKTAGGSREYTFTLTEVREVDVTVSSQIANNDLLAEVELFDSADDLVAAASPSDDAGWSVSITETLAAGDYRIAVTSIGWLDPASTGFSAYGSIGRFVIDIDASGPPGSTTTSSTSSTSSTTSTTSTTAATTSTPTSSPTTTAPPTTTTTTTVPTTTTTVPTTTTTTTSTTTSTTTTTTTTTAPTTSTTTTTLPTTPPTPPGPEPEAGARLSAVNPVRLVDTRRGLGTPGRLGAGQTVVVDIAGHPAIPDDATSVVLNAVAVAPAGAGFVSLNTCDHGAGEPSTSTVNFGTGDTANSAITTLRPDGTICIYASVATDVVVDATAWLGPGGASALTPTGGDRVVDTRSGFGGSRLTPFEPLVVDVGSVVSPSATAVAINVTTTGSAADGFLAVYLCSQGWDGDSSTLNHRAMENRANNAIAALDPGGTFCIVGSAPGDVIVDVVAEFGPTGLTYVPRVPVRILDTRNSAKLASGAATSFTVPDPGGAGAERPAAASVVVTAVGHTTGGFVTSWDCGPRPNTSVLNPIPFEANANGAIAPLTGGGTSCLFTQQPTNLLVDLSGWWL